MAGIEAARRREEYDREVASLIAQQYENYRCAESARDIVRSLGPRANVRVMKIHVARGFPQVLGARQGPEEEIVNISMTGHHVGVEVAGFVFDNQCPDGLPVEEWGSSILSDGPVELSVRPISDFFDKHDESLDVELSGFLGSRFQK